jgi:two-component system response regulator YesN
LNEISNPNRVLLWRWHLNPITIYTVRSDLGLSVRTWLRIALFSLKGVEMPYKVFFVEDEIVTREGIRDNVDWKGNGFEFCGDAPDGEMALPLLQTIKPDILITDIKMPFMDGLELCKIVRESMPGIKIVILSGHDEFEYAQQAIQLGVKEYLLKPVTPHDLHHVLQKMAAQLEQEAKERENLQKLHDQARENRIALRERLLLKLAIGAVSPTEAIEQGQALGMDLIARCYLVVIVKAEPPDRSEQFDYTDCQRVQRLVSGVVDHNPDVYLLRKGWEELVLIIKGNTPEFLTEEKDLILERIKQEVGSTRYQLTLGVGTPKKRIADIYQSFVEAWVDSQNAANQGGLVDNTAIDKAELLKVDRSAVGNFLRVGVKEDFATFFDTLIRPLGETAIKSYLIKSYIFIDIVLAAARFVSELGGDIGHIVPALNSIEAVLTKIQTIEQLQQQARQILFNVLDFRDSQNVTQHWQLIQQAKEYIDHHYMDADLSLDEVASQVNLSSSHFSVVFSQETSQTYTEYLTRLRIKKAKELLRMTSLRSTDICFQVGYSDPHYFSHVFGKQTGFSPREFRLLAQVS